MTSMESRVACLLFLSFLVLEMIGSCAASLSQEGTSLVRFREGIQEDPGGSLSNWGENKGSAYCSWFGVGCSDHGTLVHLLAKGNNLSARIYIKLQGIMVSEVVADGGQLSCRKCLTRTIRCSTLRQLLQATGPSSRHTDAVHHVAPSPSRSQSEKNKSQWDIYGPFIGGALGLAAAAATVVFISRKKKDTTVMPWATGLSGQLRKAFVTGVPSLRRTELETACEDFSNVIGTVSSSTLYKGTLSSGVEIAVASSSLKVAQQWSDRSEEQFRSKISQLSKVNHKNFMNLIGYCSFDDPFTRMMVFEYAPCGSLFEHLHIREAEHLDWPTRLRIIMGVTYCLEHMNQLDPPVTPRTLSSSSIYLTEDYAAKVSDTQFWNDDKDSASVLQSADEESIVYMFGILLLEVISGRLPFSQDHGLLVLWSSSYLEGKRPLGAMADPTLRSSSSVPDDDLEALCDVVRLCIDRDTEKRPAMGEVARLIKGIIPLSPEQTTPRDNPLWWAELEIVSETS